MISDIPIRWTDPTTWPWMFYVWLTFALAGLAKPAWSWFRRQRAAGWPVAEGRIESVEVTNTFENGFVYVPQRAGWLDPYVHELISFPNGKHDDQADSTSQALDWIKKRPDPTGLIEYLQQDRKRGDLTKIFAKMRATGEPDLRDAWGSELRMEPAPWYRDKRHYIVRSAGADQRFDNGDDMAAYLEVRTGKIVGRPDSGTIELNIEHERGPFNGRAEITGTVTDPTGAVVAAASVEVREVSRGPHATQEPTMPGNSESRAYPPARIHDSSFVAGFQDCRLARSHSSAA